MKAGERVMFYKVTDIAKNYQVTTRTVYNWMKAGMPYRKIGSVLRFDLTDVDRWTMEQQSKTKAPRRERL